jgi:hypothetical protein
MSMISPDELISEVRPWDVDSWKSFVENHVVPIKLLAETVSKQLPERPPPRFQSFYIFWREK